MFLLFHPNLHLPFPKIRTELDRGIKKSNQNETPSFLYRSESRRLRWLMQISHILEIPNLLTSSQLNREQTKSETARGGGRKGGRGSSLTMMMMMMMRTNSLLFLVRLSKSKSFSSFTFFSLSLSLRSPKSSFFFLLPVLAFEQTFSLGDWQEA